jgi:hypothetical protein
MIDISQLSPKEVQDLEKQIEKYKKSEKNLTGYKVSFYVRFNPELHIYDMLTCDGELDPVGFSDYVVDAIADCIIRDFNLKAPEDVSGAEVKVATKEELNETWGKSK